MRIILSLMICFGLAACGTKPKELKGAEPFPEAYPQPQTQGLPPTPLPAKPDQVQ